MGHATHADDAHGHDGHGHGAHAHGAQAADPHGGEIPAVPALRNITPAPEDFVGLPGPRGFAWPLFWIAVAVVGVGVLLCGGWRAFDGHHEGPSHPSGH